ncbi:MAG: serine hydrolase domain-containing protein [Pseudomonadota bacterium]
MQIHSHRACLILICGIAASSVIAVTTAAGARQVDAVELVENGLVSAVSIKGEPAQRRSIQDEMNRLHVPGVSIAVIRNGQVAWAKGYGWTREGGLPVTPDTLFQAGSISKPLTAFAALRLVDKGQLDLDSDVNARLKGWKVPVPMGTRVTLRELLSHTAGTTVHGFPGYAAGSKIPTVEDVLAGRPPAVTKPILVDTAPGTLWRYSGGGYTIVQKLIGDATRKSFADVLREEVLLPSGMRRSSFAQPLGTALLKSAAWPHDASGKPLAEGPHVYPELAAAGLWTTPSDLARFAIAVRKAGTHAPDSLLTPAMTDTMLTPIKAGYGMGLNILGTGPALSFSHGGSNAGYENTFVMFTGSGDGAVVMSNGAQGGELTGEIIRSIAKAYGWSAYGTVERPSIEVAPAKAMELAGVYEVANLGDFTIIAKPAGLAISLKDGVSEPLYAMSDGRYFILSQDMVFSIDISNATTVGRLISGPFDVPFRKIR